MEKSSMEANKLLLNNICLIKERYVFYIESDYYSTLSEKICEFINRVILFIV